MTKSSSATALSGSRVASSASSLQPATSPGRSCCPPGEGELVPGLRRQPGGARGGQGRVLQVQEPPKVGDTRSLQHKRIILMIHPSHYIRSYFWPFKTLEVRKRNLKAFGKPPPARGRWWPGPCRGRGPGRQGCREGREAGPGRGVSRRGRRGPRPAGAPEPGSGGGAAPCGPARAQRRW
jgi:hypothetical protein